MMSSTANSSRALRIGGLRHDTGVPVIPVKVSYCGLRIAEHSAADQVAGQFDIAGNRLGLSLHRGIVENEVHLRFHTGKVTLHFLERLLTPLDIGKAPLQNIQGRRLGLAKRRTLLAVSQLSLQRVYSFLQALRCVVRSRG